MGKADDLLKDMIRLHGKRIAKDVLGDLPDQTRQARRDIRAIQKALAALTKQVDKLLEERRTEAPVPAASEEDVEKARFTKRTLPSLRKRFGLTQQELAKLLHVALMTVNSWERGRKRPTDENVAKIIALRPMNQVQIDAALGRKSTAPAMPPQQIKDLRAKIGLTHRGFAKLLSVSAAAVGAWEHGRSVPREGNREALEQLGAMTQEEVNRRLGRIGGSAGTGQAVWASLSSAQILEIRKNAGLSQRGMARAIGASVNSVCNWERGHTGPRAGNIEKLLAMRK